MKSIDFAGHYPRVFFFHATTQLTCNLAVVSNCSPEVCKLFQCTAACKEISFHTPHRCIRCSHLSSRRTERMHLLTTANSQICSLWELHWDGFVSPGMEDTRLANDRVQVARKMVAGVQTGGKLCSLAIYQVYKLWRSEIEGTVINSLKTLCIKSDVCFVWDFKIYFKK